MELKLDKTQKEIVNSTANRILVIAGSGSGKTRVLTERIKKLINNGTRTDRIVAITFTNAAADEMKERLGDIIGNAFIGTIHSYANKILLINGIDTSKYIEEENFDKFFELIKENTIDFPIIEHLLVDEYQDISKKEDDFFKLLNPKNFMAVGDDYQCQPEGTKIWLRDNIIKNIEDVQVGDSVIYYDSSSGRCSGKTSKVHNAIIKKIEQIETHITQEPIITITTENGLSSSYTPEHRTYVRLHNDINKHAVYLMCDSNYRFRVGKIQLGTGKYHKYNLWKRKMLDEGCEKIWLLKILDSDKDARVEESKIAYTYGIPQTCWQLDKSTFSQEDLNYIYSEIPSKERASKCLKDYNLDIRYPLHDTSIEWLAKNHSCGCGNFLIYAINIIPNYMSALCYDEDKKNSSHKKYDLITKKEYIKNKDTRVYSLKVEGQNYVADGIVTHNCIYSFRSADVSIFMNMARDRQTKVYFMTKNYRSGAEIVEFANEFMDLVDDKIYKEAYCVNNFGEVIRLKNLNIQYIIDTIKSTDEYKDWFILTRKNSEIEFMGNILSQYNIPWDSFKKSELDSDQLKNKIKENTVKILTVHSAKGLENNNVIVVGVRPFYDDERRVAYVAATRARNLLIWIRSLKTEKKKQKINNWE